MQSRIIYEDHDMIVCHKPAGIATQTASLGQKDIVSELKNYLSEQNSKTKGAPYLGLIHRLDQPVEGLLVFAKTTASAKELSEQITKHIIRKYYYAIVCGSMNPNEGTLVDWMIKDNKTNKSKIVAANVPGAKEAKLTYKVIAKKEELSLLDIELFSGRHHQIRLQMSHSGHPILGDNKYATVESECMNVDKKVNSAALCAYKLEFNHPRTKEKLKFTIEPDHTCFLEWKETCQG